VDYSRTCREALDNDSDVAELTGDMVPLLGTAASIMAAEVFSKSSPDRDFEITNLPAGTICDDVRGAVREYFSSRDEGNQPPFVTVTPYRQGFLVSVPEFS